MQIKKITAILLTTFMVNGVCAAPEQAATNANTANQSSNRNNNLVVSPMNPGFNDAVSITSEFESQFQFTGMNDEEIAYYKKANECNRKATRPNADSWSDWTTATKKECESYSLDKAKKPIALHTQGYQLGVSSDGRRAILPDGWNDEQNKQRKAVKVGEMDYQGQKIPVYAWADSQLAQASAYQQGSNTASVNNSNNQANNSSSSSSNTVQNIISGVSTASNIASIVGSFTGNSTLSNLGGGGNCDKGNYLDIWDFCWDSVFPYRIGGVDTLESSNDSVKAPPGAHTASWCKCGEEPFAYYGIPTGYWEPARIVEVVRHPECSPTQGMKATLQLKLLNKTFGKLVRKTSGNESILPGAVADAASAAANKFGGGNNFRHFHSWPVPTEIKTVYSALRTRCADMAQNSSLETSITNFSWNASGFNPKWGGKNKTRLLMNLYYPEYYMLLDPIEGLAKGALSTVGNTVNSALRPLSCAANTTGVGLKADDLGYWLGGCFEDNLPTTGQTRAKDTLSATHNILERSIFLSARTGGYASKSTVHEGNDLTLCSPTPVLLAPKKSHYKFTMLFPYKESQESDDVDLLGMAKKSYDLIEGDSASIGGVISAIGDGVTGKVMDWLGVANTKCSHRFGASKKTWGANKNSQGDIAATYEAITSKNDKDAAYMVWRWVDCCWP
ncbi:MAG: TraU family protein [Neisseriaceae bacterium]|nr:TraU family protein [Neisseriaceae bacterium]